MRASISLTSEGPGPRWRLGKESTGSSKSALGRVAGACGALSLTACCGLGGVIWDEVIGLSALLGG